MPAQHDDARIHRTELETRSRRYARPAALLLERAQLRESNDQTGVGEVRRAQSACGRQQPAGPQQAVRRGDGIVTPQRTSERILRDELRRIDSPEAQVVRRT